jgi:flotillin
VEAADRTALPSLVSGTPLDPLVIGIVGAVVLLFLVVILVVRRVKVAGPNQAFIITGRRSRSGKAAVGQPPLETAGQKVVLGASVFVLPVVQKLHVVDLSSRRISVGVKGAISAEGIKCDLEGVAIVKVGGNEDAIRAAAQRFLDQQREIDTFTQEVLAGSLRAIVGRLTVEAIIKDRAAFASAVAEEAESSLTNQGLALDTFQLQDIQAEGSYLADIGRPEAARVKREASIAEAKAHQAAEQERFLAQEAIAVAERALALKRAEIKAETDAAEARAAAAGPLARAARDQEVLTEQEKVAERNAALKDRELDTEVRKPADARRYQTEQEAQAARNSAIFEAEAAKQAAIAQAQADAEQTRLAGEAERTRREAIAMAVEREAEAAKQAAIAQAQGEAERVRLGGEAERSQREAIAEAVEREGNAQAAAILARGRAEAEAMDKRAEAFARYGDAAVLEMLTTVLPDVVRAASEPIGQVDKITVISTDGASNLTKTVSSNVVQGLQIGSDLTGVDLRGLLRGLAARGDAREQTPAPSDSGTATPKPAQ